MYNIFENLSNSIVKNSRDEYVSTNAMIVTDEDKKETLALYSYFYLPINVKKKYYFTDKFEGNRSYTKDGLREFEYNACMNAFEEVEPTKAHKLILRMIRKDKVMELSNGSFYSGVFNLLVRGDGLLSRHYQYLQHSNRVISCPSEVVNVCSVLNGEDIKSNNGLWFCSSTEIICKKEDYNIDGFNVYNSTDEEFYNFFGVTKEEFKHLNNLLRCNGKYYAITNKNKIEMFNKLLLEKFGTNERGQCLELVEVK